MPTAMDNQARVDFRTTQDVKALIARAAAINDMSVSEFIKLTVVEKSREVIAMNETRVLSDRDRDVFLTLLDAAAAPNPALRAAAGRYRKAVEDGALIP